MVAGGRDRSAHPGGRRGALLKPPIEYAAIYCGGKGTRLREVIGEHQKCLTPVGGVPVLLRLLKLVHDAGIKRVLLLTNYKEREVWDAFMAWPGRRDFLMVTCLSDVPEEGLGAEAALRRVWAWTAHALVLNGDTLLPGFDLKLFLATFRKDSRQRAAVWGMDALTQERKEAGIWIRSVHDAELPIARYDEPDEHPFYDIGTPEGLTLARSAILTAT